MNGGDDLLVALDDAAHFIAAHVERRLALESRRPHRRFLELRLREALGCLETDRDRAVVIATEAGLVDMIEAARSAHLETLGAAGGLVALNVQWSDVGLALQRRLAETESARDRRTCPRCFDLMDERSHRRAKRDDGGTFVTRLCPRCGYTLNLVKH